MLIILEKKENDLLEDKKIHSIVMALLNYSVHILFSNIIEETVLLINKICNVEKSRQINTPFPVSNFYYFLNFTPLNCVYISILLNKMKGKTLSDIINLYIYKYNNRKTSQLMLLLPDLSERRANTIIDFFHHKYIK